MVGLKQLRREKLLAYIDIRRLSIKVLLLHLFKDNQP